MKKHLEAYFKSHDHHRLYYQVWEGDAKKPVLIFVHGLNEHCGRYQNPSNYFSSKGYTLYLFDHRGHGRSDGLRSYVDTFDDYLRDLDEFTTFVAQKEKKKKIFMIGHSMGGQIVLNYVSKFKTPLSGFVTSSANVEVALKVPFLKKWLGLQLAKIFPKLNLAGEIDPQWISRDKEVVREYKKDPLVSKTITLRLIAELLRNQESLVPLARKVTLPALMLHSGNDHLCSPKGSEKFFENLSSKDRTFIIYDDCYHELFNELDREKVFTDMELWFKKHS